MSRNISTNLVLFIITLFILTLGACGGGGGSSSEADTPVVSDTSSPNAPSPKKSPNQPKQAPKKTDSPSSPKALANLIEINPLRDLGFGKGESICFSLKSYNNITESNFSESICDKIKDDHSLTLTWNNAAGNISGYYVYFGTNKNNATNFLADVI